MTFLLKRINKKYINKNKNKNKNINKNKNKNINRYINKIKNMNKNKINNQLIKILIGKDFKYHFLFQTKVETLKIKKLIIYNRKTINKF